MNKDSLLPRSLFSASTLKLEPTVETLGKQVSNENLRCCLELTLWPFRCAFGT